MKHTILVIGLMYGDCGKGKIVHALAKVTKCDLIARFNGGANAGHTIELDSGEKLVYKQLPSGSGIPGVRAVIANGSVIDLMKLKSELEGQQAAVMLSTDAHVVTPEHILRDELQEGQREPGNKIGTTLSGNGPAYSDKATRCGLTVGQLSSEGRVNDKYDASAHMLDESPIQLIHSQEYLRRCQKYETGVMILEGAHGWELDIDHGDYPFVTSSSCGIGGAAIGTGLNPRSIDEVIGVVKAYSTRVGEGDFPYKMISRDRLHIRASHPEIGTNTKRMRRVDWMDAGRIRKACAANGVDQIALTHLDVLTGLSRVQILAQNNKTVSIPGWTENLGECIQYSDLPINAQTFVKTLEDFTGVRVGLISVGPKESQLIWKYVE